MFASMSKSIRMRLIARPPRPFLRTYATGSPPLLHTIRNDLKVAMQQKDQNQLSVLRSILAQTLNASKTSNPINTDIHLLALLRKASKTSKAASQEFVEAGRLDLAEKEDRQGKIIDGYASCVATLGDDEIKSTIQSVIDTMRQDNPDVQTGDLLKRLFAPERLGSKAVDKGHVANMAKQMLSSL